MPPSIYPTGATIYDPENAYNCFILNDGRDGKSYLIDMTGHIVHTWPRPGFPVEMIDPELNHGKLGHGVCQNEPEIYSCEKLLVLDWDGNIVWQWGENAPGGKAGQNHDLCPMPDGHLLILQGKSSGNRMPPSGDCPSGISTVFLSAVPAACFVYKAWRKI